MCFWREMPREERAGVEPKARHIWRELQCIADVTLESVSVHALGLHGQKHHIAACMYRDVGR